MPFPRDGKKNKISFIVRIFAYKNDQIEIIEQLINAPKFNAVDLL